MISGGRALARDGIEDAHLLPVRLVFGNEPMMRLGQLVVVVGRLVLEDDVQADVELAVVDLATSASARTPQAKKTIPGCPGRCFRHASTSLFFAAVERSWSKKKTLWTSGPSACAMVEPSSIQRRLTIVLARTKNGLGGRPDHLNRAASDRPARRRGGRFSIGLSGTLETCRHATLLQFQRASPSHPEAFACIFIGTSCCK